MNTTCPLSQPYFEQLQESCAAYPQIAPKKMPQAAASKAIQTYAAAFHHTAMPPESNPPSSLRYASAHSVLPWLLTVACSAAAPSLVQPQHTPTAASHRTQSTYTLATLCHYAPAKRCRSCQTPRRLWLATSPAQRLCMRLVLAPPPCS